MPSSTYITHQNQINIYQMTVSFLSSDTCDYALMLLLTIMHGANNDDNFMHILTYQNQVSSCQLTDFLFQLMQTIPVMLFLVMMLGC